MISHAAREPREECCGLLAGRDAAITAIFPATNAAENPATAYEIAPREIFRIVREIRAAGLELLGIYHSHPNGENAPSPRDIERAYYPDAAYFILSPRPAPPHSAAPPIAPRPKSLQSAGSRADPPRPEETNSVRAFSIRDGAVTELPVEML